jgi:hypothetical protein
MGNRTCDLPACGIVPQPATLLRSPTESCSNILSELTSVELQDQEIQEYENIKTLMNHLLLYSNFISQYKIANLNRC